MQFQRGVGAQAQVIFLQARGDVVVEHRRLRQLAVFRAQGSGDVLHDHHPGVHPRVGHQEGRQTADVRVDQTVQATLGDGADFRHGDGQQVRRQCHGLAVRVGLGHHAVIVCGAQHQRVVGGAVEFGFDLSGRVHQLVTGRAMHLRDRANAQRVLGANTLAPGNHFAAVEQGPQVDPDLLHARMRLERDDLGIEGVDLAALGFETHGADHIRPMQQARGIGDRQAAQAGHAGRAVDQAQPILGTQLDRLQPFFCQGLLRGNDLPAIAHITDAQQGDADMSHVGQVAHRALGWHLRGDATVEQRQQRLNHLAMQPGFTVAVVDDGGAHD